MPRLPRRLAMILAVAAGVSVVPALYAGQVVRKLDRAVGEAVPLSVCEFSLFCDRVPAAGVSLPMPRLSCEVRSGKKPRSFLWSPLQNAWVEERVSAACCG